MMSQNTIISFTQTQLSQKKIPKKSPLPIKGCQGMHMIAYHPNGTILTKTNICSCANCLVGKFMSCNDEKGSVAVLGSKDSDDSESDSGTESESSDNESDSDKFDEEVGEIRMDNVLDILSADSIIALFSHSISMELFYLCKVLKFGVAEEDMTDGNHKVSKGQSFILCNYYERIDEKRLKVFYKLLKDEVPVYPTQVMCQLVVMNDDLSLNIEEYQYISDMMV